MSNIVAVIILTTVILSTGLGLVYTKHQSRKLFIELQAVQAARDELEIEWELLQLEQSTLAAEAVVDHVARTRLDMVIPDPHSVVYIIR